MSTSTNSRTIRNQQLRALLWTGLVAATALLIGCEPTVDDESGDGCVVGDDIYPPGATFTAPDGCNTCTCGEDGAVACTEMACVEGCDYGGQFYEVGEGFDANDGCNSCVCESNDTVACTTMACVDSCFYNGQTYNVGDQFEPEGGSMCGNMCTCLEDGTVDCEFCAS